jgi:hypothetical protein
MKTGRYLWLLWHPRERRFVEHLARALNLWRRGTWRYASKQLAIALFRYMGSEGVR